MGIIKFFKEKMNMEENEEEIILTPEMEEELSNGEGGDENE